LSGYYTCKGVERKRRKEGEKEEERE